MFVDETFWTLLRDKAHWEFEIFLMLLFDGLVGAIMWPFIKRHWNHHIERDKKEAMAEEPEAPAKKRQHRISRQEFYFAYILSIFSGASFLDGSRGWGFGLLIASVAVIVVTDIFGIEI